ncbi:MAG: outer membrane protein assembly factor [Proteobacteria bacterium]|nr:outer membrane protein assembly factor [Pseudomonadota bacterium]
MAIGCCLGAVLLGPSPALAFDFFGLFGDDKPPAVSQQALPYLLEFQSGESSKSLDKDLKEALEQASTLYRTRQDPPPDGETLVRRAEGDLAPLLDALWGAGYYDAALSIQVASQRLALGRTTPPNVARAAESFRAREAVPVKIVVTPGPLFHLRSIGIVDARTRRPFPPEQLPPKIVKLRPGDPARAADIRAAQAALIDHFRGLSYPLAKVIKVRPTVFHRDDVMDVEIAIDTGSRAPFGPVTVSGKSNVDPKVVRSMIYIEPGDPYSPAAVAASRKSVLKLPAISSVRMREPDHLDANGQLPIDAEVTDRKPHVVGLSARYSTLDGPALRAYWQHRNLFGGAESLRLEGDLFVPPRTNSRALDNLKDFELADLGGRFKASFVKPGLYGTRNDLLLDGMVERDNTGGDIYGGYSSKRATAAAAIRHRFTDTFSTQFGVTGERGTTSDSLGTVDYSLFGLQAAVTYDSTDRLLDPTKGIRATGTVTAYPEFLGSSVGIVESKAQASTYYAIDDEARYVLAGRIGLGSVTGASLGDIPSTHRFYAGGGGSVRGYRFRSLSPLGPTGEVIGGRSLVEASLEARIKITDTIGLVPFFDAGGAFEPAYPDFSQPLRYSAGLGLRYYTAVGPIRVDVALPLNRREGDNRWALYVGIGQAF